VVLLWVVMVERGIPPERVLLLRVVVVMVCGRERVLHARICSRSSSRPIVARARDAHSSPFYRIRVRLLCIPTDQGRLAPPAVLLVGFGRVTSMTMMLLRIVHPPRGSRSVGGSGYLTKPLHHPTLLAPSSYVVLPGKRFTSRLIP
jgi:hypothetical protein